jgi:hypothetical protein
MFVRKEERRKHVPRHGYNDMSHPLKCSCTTSMATGAQK